MKTSRFYFILRLNTFFVFHIRVDTNKMENFGHLICNYFANFINMFRLIAAQNQESSLHRGTALDYWSVWVNFIQQQTSANCRWSTIICSTSECFTEVVSYVHFTQEMTSPTISASRKLPRKNSLCITSAVFSPSARAQPALINSHCPCRDVMLHCKHPFVLTGCLAPCTPSSIKFGSVAFGEPLGW